MRDARCHERALARVVQVLLERLLELPARRVDRFVLADAAAHPHHVGQRPVSDTFAVWEAPSAVPVDLVDDAVEVLVELPREPRLADASDPGQGHDIRVPLRRAVEEFVDVLELALAADERRVETGRREHPAHARDHPQRAEQMHCLRLALQLVPTGVLVRDRLLGRAAGGVSDQHRPGLGRTLDPRGGVHQIAGDHPLTLGADRDRRLAGQDTRACLERRVEARDRLDEVERRPHRPLGVVLRRDGRTPHGHHRVADELLHRSAVAADQRARQLEVAGEEIARLLGIPALGERGEADEVREKHGDEPSFGGRDPRRRRRRRSDDSDLEIGATLAAELRARRVARATRRADAEERSPALVAELGAFGVVCAATRTGHACAELYVSEERVALASSSQVLPSERGDDAAARRSLQEAELQQIRRSVLDRLGLLASETASVEETGPPPDGHECAEQFADRTARAPPSRLEQCKRLLGDMCRDDALVPDLGNVAHAPQDAVRDARRSPRPGGDQLGGLVGHLDAEDASRPSDDRGELRRRVQVEPKREPEAVA
jgi:hypothetical protein